MELITYNRPRKAVVLDVDGVLMPCAELGIKRWNKEHPQEPPMKLEEITGYGVTGTRTDDLLAYYGDENFYHAQKPYPGAQEFVRKLCDRMDVYFLTAVPDHVVQYRSRQLRKFFPEVPPSNVFFGSVKERFVADYSLDDCPDHILAQYESGAVQHPVIMRCPWNAHLSGIMSVNGYEDFITFIDMVERFGARSFARKGPYVVALVGPAGSNKGALCQRLIEKGCVRLPSYTTSAEKADEVEGYTHVSVEEFLMLRDEGAFVETTSYARNYYGILKEGAGTMLKDGRHGVTVVDVCGAVTLKRIYGEQCLMVYVQREHEALLTDLLERHTGAELISRLQWLSAEQKNRKLCDLTVDNTDVDAAADALFSFMEGASKSGPAPSL
jgi:guanylate kinase